MKAAEFMESVELKQFTEFAVFMEFVEFTEFMGFPEAVEFCGAHGLIDFKEFNIQVQGGRAAHGLRGVNGVHSAVH